MGDVMRKVQTGDALAIPAAAYNAFIDAAIDHQSRQQTVSARMSPDDPPSHRITIRNDCGYDLTAGSVLGLGNPVIDPDDNLDAFKQRVVLCGVQPVVSQHSRGRFAVLSEPIGQSRLGQADIHGVCPAYVNVVDETHQYADVVVDDFPLLQSVGGHGVEMLWKQSGTGLKWAIVRLGRSIPSSLFPVTLSQIGGAQGTGTSANTYTYSVTHRVTGEVLIPSASPIDPTMPPGVWVRSLGQVTAATAGLAYYDANQQLVLTWINEVPSAEVCSTS